MESKERPVATTMRAGNEQKNAVSHFSESIEYVEDPHAISRRVLGCQALFKVCQKYHVLSGGDVLDKMAAEFSWWSIGIGAGKPGRSSLDYRVRTRGDVRAVIVGLLDSLVISLGNCVELAKAAQDGDVQIGVSELSKGKEKATDSTHNLIPPRVPDEDSPLGEQFYYMRSSVDSLVKICAAIRKSGTKFRHHQADKRLSEREAELEEFRKYLKLVVLVGPTKQNLLHGILYRYTDTREPIWKKLWITLEAYFKDPRRLSLVQERLIEANLIRRNRLELYFSEYRRKTDDHGTAAAQASTPKLPEFVAIPSQAVVTTVQIQDLEQAEPPPIARPEPREPSLGGGSARSSREATELAKSFVMPKGPGSRGTRSVASRVSQGVLKQDYPRCPAKEGENFWCPFCALPLDKTHSDPKKTGRWRGHVAEDVNPYVCVYPDCEKPVAEAMYVSSDDWKKHMREAHSEPRWICDTCWLGSEDPGQFEFESERDWVEHTTATHRGKFREKNLPALAEASRRKVLPPVACPLCFEGAAPLHPETNKHIAEHLHSFALQALPWETIGPDDDDNDDTGASVGSAPRRLADSKHIAEEATEEEIDWDESFDLPLLIRLIRAHCLSLAAKELPQLLADTLSDLAQTLRHLSTRHSSFSSDINDEIAACLSSLESISNLENESNLEIISLRLGSADDGSFDPSFMETLGSDIAHGLGSLKALLELAESKGSDLDGPGSDMADIVTTPRSDRGHAEEIRAPRGKHPAINILEVILQFFPLFEGVPPGKWWSSFSRGSNRVHELQLIIDQTADQIEGIPAVGTWPLLREAFADCLAEARVLHAAISVVVTNLDVLDQPHQYLEAIQRELGPVKINNMATTLAQHRGQMITDLVVCLWEESQGDKHTLPLFQGYVTSLQELLDDFNTKSVTLQTFNRPSLEMQWDSSDLSATRREIMDVLIDCDWDPGPLDPKLEPFSEQLRLAKHIATSFQVPFSHRRHDMISRAYEPTFEWIWERNVPVTEGIFGKVDRQKQSSDKSSRSTRSSGASRDESDYWNSNTTRTTRSFAGDGEANIRIKGGATLRLGEMEIQCKDGGEIILPQDGGTHGGSDRGSTIWPEERPDRRRIDNVPHRPKWSSFPMWLEAAEEKLYWIMGKPASGKSTLMRFIQGHNQLLEHLQRWKPELPLHIWSYYAWNLGTPAEKSIDGLVRSILAQALGAMPHLVPVVAPREWAFKTTLWGAPYPEDWKVEDMKSYEEAMYRLLAACRSRAKLVIFIDGLNEFGDEPERLIRVIHRMSEQGSAKICVASRPWLAFSDQFGASPHLAIHELTAGDIETYVRERLQRSAAARERASEVYQLQRKVIQAAEGVFYWVVVVVNLLIRQLEHGESLESLHRAVEELPKDFYHLYSAVCSRTTDQPGMKAQEIFALKAASQGGDLHFVTLWAVSRLELAPQHRLRIVPRNYEQLKDTVSRLLMSPTLGLLEIDSQDKVIYLHSTVSQWASQELEPPTLQTDLAIIEGLCTLGSRVTLDVHDLAAPKWSMKYLLLTVIYHMSKLAGAQAAYESAAEDVVSWLKDLEKIVPLPSQQDPDAICLRSDDPRGYMLPLYPRDFTVLLACIGYEPFIRPRMEGQDLSSSDGNLYLACLYGYGYCHDKFPNPSPVALEIRMRLVRLYLENGGRPFRVSNGRPEVCTLKEAASEMRLLQRGDLPTSYEYARLGDWIEKFEKTETARPSFRKSLSKLIRRR